MRAPLTEPTEFIATFSRQRQQLLARAAQTFDAEPEPEPSPELRLSTQCLATSLEELKVAEEEMLTQQMELLATKAEADRKITYFRTLFDLAPAPLMLTTNDGIIRACNQAMATLLTRDVYHLEGKPLVAVVGTAFRADFRPQLKRVVEAGGVTSWKLTLERKTRGPVDVLATVQIVPSALTGTLALYWSVRETETATAAG
jgi:PAS domain-containing protein